MDINILYWAAPRLSQRIQELSLAGLQSPEDQKEQFAIEAALQLVQDECSPKIASLAETLPRNKIRWETLWMILPPNVYVYTKDEFGQDRVFLLRRHRQRRKEDNSVVLEMETEHVDSDGSKLGVVQNVIELPQFEGVSAIADLPVYPLEYHPRVNEVTKELLDRGKKQLKYHRPGPGQRHTVTEHKRYGFKPGLKNLEKFNVSIITISHRHLVLLILVDPWSPCHRCSGYGRSLSPVGPLAQIDRFSHSPRTSTKEQLFKQRHERKRHEADL